MIVIHSKILWSHLSDLYKKDTEQGVGLKLIPKLKYEHISLTTFSKMRVDLAAQVLELAESLQQGSKSEKLISFLIKTFYYRVCFVAAAIDHKP